MYVLGFMYQYISGDEAENCYEHLNDLNPQNYWTVEKSYKLE